MSLKDSLSNALDVVATTISNGTSLSGSINLGGLRLFAIATPSAWTAASLTFQVSPDGGTTWTNLYDSNGNETTFTIDVSHYITLDPIPFSSAQYLRIRSGTSGTPVAQGADRLFQLILRSI